MKKPTIIMLIYFPTYKQFSIFWYKQSCLLQIGALFLASRCNISTYSKQKKILGLNITKDICYFMLVSISRLTSSSFGSISKKNCLWRSAYSSSNFDYTESMSPMVADEASSRSAYASHPYFSLELLWHQRFNVASCPFLNNARVFQPTRNSLKTDYVYTIVLARFHKYFSDLLMWLRKYNSTLFSSSRFTICTQAFYRG